MAIPKSFDRCVKKVKAKGNVRNPYAICRASMGTDAQIYARQKNKTRRTMTRMGKRPK